MIVLFYIGLFSILAAVVILLVPVFISKCKNLSGFNSNEKQIVSIIVPYRNESKNLEQCILSLLDSLKGDNKSELILVNDHSEDEGNSIADFFANKSDGQIRSFSLPEKVEGKKSAVEFGISKSKGDVIVLRDADTFGSGAKWLNEMTSVFADNSVSMCVGPLEISRSNSLIGQFQYCENIYLQTIAFGYLNCGKPFLCSAANLAFRKSVFIELGGYEGNHDIRSGDDVFLLNKIVASGKGRIVAPYSISDTLVVTQAEKGIRNILHQKVRWAGKLGRIWTWQAICVSGIQIISAGLFIVFGLLSLLLEGWYKYLIPCMLFKLIIDFLLLFLGSAERKGYRWILLFPFLELINVFYTLLLPFAILLMKGEWKGRKLK